MVRFLPAVESRGSICAHCGERASGPDDANETTSGDTPLSLKAPCRAAAGCAHLRWQPILHSIARPTVYVPWSSRRSTLALATRFIDKLALCA